MAHSFHNAAAGDEKLAHILVGEQIQVAPPVAELHILEAVPFFRQGVQSFGEEAVFLHVQGYLTGAGAEEVPMSLNEIANVKVLEEKAVIFLSQHVVLEEKLYFAAAIGDVGKGDLAHLADGNEPAGKYDLLFAKALIGFVVPACLSSGVSPLNTGGIGVYPMLTDAFKLEQALALLIGKFL